MSVIPEFVLQKAVIAGFRAMREDSRILDTIFAQMHQDQLAAVKKFVLESQISWDVNFPKEDVTVPRLVLILKDETEGSTFLGDVMGDKTDYLHVPIPELSYDTLGGHGASTSDSKGLPVKVAGPIAVASQDDVNSITFQDGEDITAIVQNLLENPPGCLTLYVVEGTGAGKVYDIFRLRPDGLDIIGAFDPELDATSVVDIRKPSDPMASDGEPSRVYDSNGSYLRKGVNYKENYALHVLAGKQEEVIYLYATIKALLLSQRAYLESQGVMNLSIGGSDLAPRTEFLPDEIFQRAMSLRFEAPFSFLEPQVTYDKIQINYWVGDDLIVKYPITL